MHGRRREIETLLLPAIAAVPLYFTGAIGPLPLIAFHAALLAMIVRVAGGRSPQIFPEAAMRAIAIAYVPLYVVDAAVNHAIAASTHLVLFIAVYQPIESMRRDNRAQRLLTAALIFVASIATSTHIAVVAFVVGWAFLMFRQMMLLSHLETARSVGREYADAPSSRAAVFYLAGTTVLAAFLFPVVPRVRNPIVHGITGTLTNATTGLSSTIDFSQDRSSTPDASVVARVWMGQEAIPFFTPLRLRGTVYDRYLANEWRQAALGFREIRPSGRDGTYRVARARGFTRSAHVQQRLIMQTRLFLPVGTYAVSGVPVFEGPAHDVYVTYQQGHDLLNYDVSMAIHVEPTRPLRPTVIAYPVTPAVATLAHAIVRDETAPLDQAHLVEQYMLRNFHYVQHPEQIGHSMTVDDFLLKERRGHCEYFAAGMVALMTALNVPARIVGGFYGGVLNPLTGYFIVRREDAHAWVEVWSGTGWETFDPTPPSLRPGNVQGSLFSTYVNAISDSVNYFWDRYVLTYGLSDQIALVANLIARARDTFHGSGHAFGSGKQRLSLGRIAAFAGGLLPLLLFAWLVGRGRRSIFDDLARALALHGIVVGPSMTMEEALARLREEKPDAAREIEPLVELYDAERFSAHPDRSRVKRIRRKLAELRA